MDLIMTSIVFCPSLRLYLHFLQLPIITCCVQWVSADTFLRVGDVSEIREALLGAADTGKVRGLIPPSPARTVDFGRVMVVFLSAAWRFAGGLSDRFRSLKHPSVFIHGLYGSFHKTFTP